MILSAGPPDPAKLHAEYAVRVLDAGKHVLCELPLAASMADARRVVDAQAASDRQVFVDMFGRFDPATEVLLGYPTAIARCSASALLPKPYGMRGGYRAVFTEAAVESSWTAGYGRPTTTLTEYTEQGQREIDLPIRTPTRR